MRRQLPIGIQTYAYFASLGLDLTPEESSSEKRSVVGFDVEPAGEPPPRN